MKKIMTIVLSLCIIMIVGTGLYLTIEKTNFGESIKTSISKMLNPVIEYSLSDSGSEDLTEWTNFHRDLAKTGYYPDEINDTGATLLWNLQFADYLGNRGSPMVSNGMVVTHAVGKVHGINASTGQSIWNTTCAGDQASGAIAYGTYFTINDTLDNAVAINISTGNVVWATTTSVGQTHMAMPVVYKGITYFNNGTNTAGYNASTGAVEFDGGEYTSYGSISIDADRIFYSGTEHTYAMNATTGVQIWENIKVNTSFGTPTYANDKLYVGSDNYGMYILNSTDGTEICKYPTLGEVNMPNVAVAFDIAVFPSSVDKKFHAVNATNCSEIWNYTTTYIQDSSPVITSNRLVLTGGYDNNTRIINLDTGALVWNYSIQTHRSSFAVAKVGDDTYGFIQTYLKMATNNTLFAFNLSKSTIVPSIELSIPLNLTNTTTTSPIFNCTGNDIVELHNVSLIINGTRKYTKSNTGVNNISLEETIVLGDGSYNWTCNATSAINERTQGGMWELKIDSTAPIVTIQHPLNQTYTNNFTDFNYTYDEPHPSNCWYSNDSGLTTSIPIAMGTNFTIALKEGTTNLSVYCNDTTFNNVGIDSVLFYLDTIPPDVNITSPINNTNHTSNAIDINYTRDITNVNTCWYSNDSYTSITLLPLCVNLTNIIWAEGMHNVTIWVNDSVNGQNSSNITFGIDSITPDANITFPLEIVEFRKLNNNLTINWSVSDTNLKECWGSYDNGKNNETLVCLDNNVTINITSITSNNTFTFWANDTTNNINSSVRNWNYNLIENNQTFSEETIVGNLETFVVNISYNNTAFTNIQANFYYNNTKYVGVQDGTGVTIEFNKTISIPSLSAKSNQSVYWTIGLNNGSWNYYNLSISNQTVNFLTIDNCTANTWVVYNFSIKDEKTQALLVPTTQNTTADVTLTLYTLDRGTLIANLSTTYVKRNPFEICLNNNLSDAGIYSTDVQIQYYADAYSKEYYNIQNATLSSSSRSNNISLYDLDNITVQKFVISYKDGNLLPVENALIQIQRKYISEGVFKVVEIPRTDFNGETTASIETEDVIYTIIVTKMGEILATFNEMKAVCQTPVISTCLINLNSFSTSIEPIDFTKLEDFSFTLTYDKDTRTIQSVYTVPSGTSRTVKINATLSDSLGTTEVCSDSLTSSSGTLSCTIPTTFGNGSAIITLTKDDDVISKSILSMEQDSSDIYGVGLIFLTTFLFLTLIGLGLGDSPTTMGIFLLLGSIIAVVLNLVNTGTSSFIGAGATILWIIVAIVIVIMKGSNRQ